MRKYYGWDSKFCIDAANVGKIKVFQWQMQNGCPGDAIICTKAVQYGNLELLKSAHEIGRDLAKEAYAFCLTACGLEIPIDAILTEPRESHDYI